MKASEIISKVFGRKKDRRQARYTFDMDGLLLHPELPGVAGLSHEEVYREILQRFAVTIVARQYNALPPQLQSFFVRGKK